MAGDRRPQAVAGAYVAADHHVFQHAHFVEQPQVLEGASDAGLRHFIDRTGPVALALQAKFALVGAIQTGDQIEAGGFTGAVRPDQAVDFSTADAHADVIHRRQAAEAFADVV